MGLVDPTMFLIISSLIVQLHVHTSHCTISLTLLHVGSSPHVIQGLGQHTINVTPVSIEGCLNVIGRSLLINVPNN